MSAKWASKDPRTNEWSYYDPNDSHALEMSYNADKQPVHLDFAGVTFTVDVKKMMQTNRQGGSRQVRREAPKDASSKAQNYINKSLTAEGDLTVEQFEAFFTGLGLDLATVDPFILLWKMECKGCWSATKEELMSGFGEHQLDERNVRANVASWKQKIQKDYDTFKAFYSFIFNFIRNSTSASVIQFEECGETLGLVLKLTPKPFTFPVNDCLSYLKEKNKPLNSDHWKQLLRFLTTMPPSCDGYDEAFFPSLFDDLAEKCAKKS